MTIEKHTVITVDPDQNEMESLFIVDNFFHKIQEQIENKDILISLDTGEAIEIKELNRVRGIISAFYEQHHHWEVE